jgi:hypothetical protein
VDLEALLREIEDELDVAERRPPAGRPLGGPAS